MPDKLLLHICCGPCAAVPVIELRNEFSLGLIFFNPNIYPEEEYKKRLDTVVSLAAKMEVELAVSDYDHSLWLCQTKDLGSEPEGGRRCNLCYKIRLNAGAKYAKENGYNYFATTLTISPHKRAEIINPIGLDAGRLHGVLFLEKDFKKNDGFKHSCDLSREYGLYRQKYCGCEFSIK